MIISASRRTDIPAFYSTWLMNRIRAGYAAVPNPYYPEKVSRVSLLPEAVDGIVFTTRNPRPMLRHLDELDERGYAYYFMVTVVGNPREIDPKSPGLASALDNFLRLSDRVGAERAIWRYDPIVLSSRTGIDDHLRHFQHIARRLQGRTRRCVISYLDDYRKAQPRLRGLPALGIHLATPREVQAALAPLTVGLAQIAGEAGMEITSCAEIYDLRPYGVRPGKCIDDELLTRISGRPLALRKDPSQRKVCGCAQSRDIGMYDSCLFGCLYCYATQDFARSALNYRRHDPLSPSLIGWIDAPGGEAARQPRLFE